MTEDFLIPLIRLLAERHGQRQIAAVLNERQLYPDNKGARWNQRRVSDFMKEHSITPMYKFKVHPEYVKEINEHRNS